ncbi:kinase-like domain-containing protein [Fomitopsis serialis]|uniref:kinase-like domain-containing protein n=1 Tax=Fomitopsis serialis TaxID=139415 RepID=UPI0020079296|nr:kinase-like domain-containing protein [Neoantrodia serialis]KAH9927799.1 kinase-like domain-containing protein [Neoantrodia serialis]
MSMFKRMTDKLGHLQVSSPKPAHSHANLATGGTASATALPASPASSYASTSNTLSTSAYPYASEYGAYQRGSISTECTSLSGYSNNNSNIPKPVPAATSIPAASAGASATAQRRDRNDREESMYVEDALPARFLALRPKGSYRLGDFIIQRTLGTGSFGRVHLVRSKHNLRFYAVKVMLKEKIVRTKQVSHTRNEQRMLCAVQHPFIINLWGTFQDSTNLYMVMDFVPGGELFTLLRRSNRFPDPVAKFYAAEVALALNYLHSLDIIYRDLKPENILLNFDGHIKIADFGFARWCETTVWTLCGTPDYLAPEIIGNARYNKSVDWYALGVLTFEMLSGLPPFHEPDISPVKLYEKITVGPAYIKWPDFHPNAKDLILKLMEADPSKRYGNLRHGAGDVFAHRWFSEVDWDKLRNREIQAPYLPRINGDGDASAFERYPEIDASMQYGAFGPDPYGDQFPDFEYTAP